MSPLLPQLHLSHALRHDNVELALRICRERDLDEEDRHSVRAYCARQENWLLQEDAPKHRLTSWKQRGELLALTLERCPELLETPELRQGLAAVAIALPQPDERVRRWVERMADGVARLKNIPLGCGAEDDIFAVLLELETLEHHFFPRWEERMGHRLIPALHRDTHLENLCGKDLSLLLERFAVEERGMSYEHFLRRFASPRERMLLDPDGRDTYAAEAVNALVRHMELEPETMVIFATYPEEMKQLLSSNPGLSSCVAQVLEFPDYTGEELFDIFKTFAQQERLNLPENADRLCGGFFQKLRGRKGTDFGNGREARRLFQAAKEEMALRALSDPGVLSDLSEEDLRGAMERLLKQEREKTRTRIGFGA